MLLMQQFILFGYRVSAVSGGEDAFKQWVGGEFDAVITDSRMPDVDGSALTRSIRQYEKQASCVALSDHWIYCKCRCGGARALLVCRNGRVFFQTDGSGRA